MLFRLSKMLRLARIKRILSKWGKQVNFQQYVNIGFTCFTIIFLAHLLACGFYGVGKLDQYTPLTNSSNLGWVHLEAAWCAHRQM